MNFYFFSILLVETDASLFAFILCVYPLTVQLFPNYWRDQSYWKAVEGCILCQVALTGNKAVALWST